MIWLINDSSFSPEDFILLIFLTFFTAYDEVGFSALVFVKFASECDNVEVGDLWVAKNDDCFTDLRPLYLAS